VEYNEARSCRFENLEEANGQGWIGNGHMKRGEEPPTIMPRSKAWQNLAAALPGLVKKVCRRARMMVDISVSCHGDEAPRSR
jgi:hypothetical protein